MLRINVGKALLGLRIVNVRLGSWCIYSGTLRRVMTLTLLFFRCSLRVWSAIRSATARWTTDPFRDETRSPANAHRLIVAYVALGGTLIGMAFQSALSVQVTISPILFWRSTSLS